MSDTSLRAALERLRDEMQGQAPARFLAAYWKDRVDALLAAHPPATPECNAFAGDDYMQALEKKCFADGYAEGIKQQKQYEQVCRDVLELAYQGTWSGKPSTVEMAHYALNSIAENPPATPPQNCKFCAEGIPLKEYFDGRMMHFDELMAWTACTKFTPATTPCPELCGHFEQCCVLPEGHDGPHELPPAPPEGGKISATLKYAGELKPLPYVDESAPEGGLEGPIKIGDELIWEPYNLRCREEITVSDVVTNERGQVVVYTRTPNGKIAMNDESRIREACIRASPGNRPPATPPFPKDQVYLAEDAFDTDSPEGGSVAIPTGKQIRAWLRERGKTDERVREMFDSIGAQFYFDELVRDFMATLAQPRVSETK